MKLKTEMSQTKTIEEWNILSNPAHFSLINLCDEPDKTLGPVETSADDPQLTLLTRHTNQHILSA